MVMFLTVDSSVSYSKPWLNASLLIAWRRASVFSGCSGVQYLHAADIIKVPEGVL